MGRLWIVGTRILHGATFGPRISSRSISMSSPRAAEVLEKLEKNPYYEKYAERIAALQQASPDEFLRRAQATAPARPAAAPARPAAAPARPAAAPAEPAAPDVRQFSSVLNPKTALQNDVAVEEKKLEAIFKTDLVIDKDASEIQSIWEKYHRNKEVISATIPVQQYNSLRERMRQSPTFVFPLPRAHGYEFIMCQSSGHTVHFTPLLAFQVHKENAPECLTMVHYSELKDKGIVLMRGEYDKNVLNGQEAQCLANQFQMYYSGKDLVKSQLLQTFTANPDSFQHMDLISEMENITLV